MATRAAATTNALAVLMIELLAEGSIGPNVSQINSTGVRAVTGGRLQL
jgi:hypothetical protein